MMPLDDEFAVAVHVDHTEHGLWCPFCDRASASRAVGFVWSPVRFERLGGLRYVSCQDCGEDLSDMHQEVDP